MSAVDFPGIRSNKHHALGWRTFSRVAAVFALVTSLAWAILSLAWPKTPVHVHVRWKPDVTDTQRAELERRFQLTDSQPGDGVTWEYQLVDSSTANVRAIVQNERVDDTAHLNRIRYRPEFAQDRSRQILAYSIGTGAVASLLLLVFAFFFARTALLSVPSSDLAAAVSARLASMRASGPILQASTTHPSFSRLVTTAVLVTSVLTTVAMTSLAGTPFWSAAAALVVLYVCGYVAGSLLLDGVGGWPWAIVRTVAGFLLTTIGFLLSLVLSLPWFLGPIAVIAAAVWLRGRWAFAWSSENVRLGWDGIAAVMLAVILVSPIAVTFFYMAPGSYPPVFYNVDTPPVLEKVHGLVIGNTFPPESLSNIGARRTYHYGTQAMAALISRSSGLLPHHALFLIVLPVLTIGVIAAAFAAARHVSPALPRSVAVPLLLISMPSLSATFWGRFGPQLWAAATSRGFSIDGVIGDFALWGILSNEAKNVGGDFIVLASVAGIAAVPSLGWRLPVFLIGSAVLVKTPAGVALLAGFMLADAWRAVAARRLLPSPQVLIAGTVFLATLVAFFLASSEPNFRVVLSPLYHLRGIVSSGGLSGIAFDLLWLLLPALIVLSARIDDPEKRSAPFLLMGLAPILVVNVTGLEHIAETGGGAGDDWLQILHSVPFLLHAFALSLASWRWAKLGPRRRVAVLLTMALAIVPVVTAAARYSVLLVRNPEGGHEFVDNRSLATALAVIPTKGTVIVTNDLRYPAQNFSRDERQMQIPALFGHQAFAVNYAYEVVPSARERRELQQLLQQPAWSDRILEAARTHRWTHLVIRKDYVHPSPIPLEQIFENEFYAVFRFP
jgi:hypothetical protein